MATYVILSRISPGSFAAPKDFKAVAATVSEKIKAECPAVSWKESYATMGGYDVVDLVESNDPQQVQRAAMIIRSYGKAYTETLAATPWKKFIEGLG